MAQQNPPFQGPHCDAFTKNADGEWVAKQDMTILGPFGPVKIKAGQPVDDEIQERLDDLCNEEAPMRRTISFIAALLPYGASATSRLPYN